MSRSKEARAAAMRLAIQRLNEATDLLTPHAADDRVLFAAAEISGSVATVLHAQMEGEVEVFAPVADQRSTVQTSRGVRQRCACFEFGDRTNRCALEAGHNSLHQTDKGHSFDRVAADEEPPFDASAYERPEHHVSCLCPSCNSARAGDRS